LSSGGVSYHRSAPALSAQFLFRRWVRLTVVIVTDRSLGACCSSLWWGAETYLGDDNTLVEVGRRISVRHGLCPRQKERNGVPGENASGITGDIENVVYKIIGNT
jgi:hypothetical protein